MNWSVRAPLLVAALVALNACASSNSTSSTETGKIRQSVQTAPADLQLLCSAAAARKFGLNRNDILPVGSDVIAPDTFQVDVKTTDGTIRCIVNRDGVISELAWV